MEIVKTSSHLGSSNYLLQHSVQVRLFSKIMKPRVIFTETLLCLFGNTERLKALGQENKKIKMALQED